MIPPPITEIPDYVWRMKQPAYLGTSDPRIPEDFTRRLLPYYAAKVPYVYDMAYHRPLPEASVTMIEKTLVSN